MSFKLFPYPVRAHFSVKKEKGERKEIRLMGIERDEEEERIC